MKSRYFYIFNNGIISDQGMSGSDQRVYHWAQIFKRKGHKITLFIPQIGFERFKNLGFDLIITTQMNTLRLGYFFTYLWRALKGSLLLTKLGKIGGDSVIYSSSDLIADAIPAIFMKIMNPKAKLICGLHLLAPHPLKGFTQIKSKALNLPRLKLIYYFLSQRLVICLLKRFADLVLVSNLLDKEFLLKKRFKSNQVLITYGGVNFKLIPKEKIPIKFAAVWVGRLHPQKGVKDLFLTWQKVVNKLPRAKLAIVGENDLQEYFFKEKLPAKLKDNLIFTGYLNGKSLFTLLKSSKVFLYPSYYESFGLVIAEAMAAGLPVIAYDLPVYQVIYKSGMSKIPVGNTNALAKTIIYLLTHPKEREKIANQALKVSQQFSWQKTAEKILQAIEKND